MSKKIRTKRIILIIVAIVLLLAAGTRLALMKNPGWHSISGKKVCYSNDSGKILTGYQLIEGEPYYFNVVGIPKEHGWVEAKEGDFFCEGEGKLAVGWHYIGDKAFYFYENNDKPDNGLVGAQAVNYVTAGGLAIGDKGYLEGEEALAIAYALDVLNRYGWSLESAYKYASSLEYAGDSSYLYGFTIHTIAIQGFKYGKGNCLAWTAPFCVMAKVMGYDCRLIWGTLPYRGKQVHHAWAEIWEEDGIHVYDPRRHLGKDMSGFDERYGEKGSRKYNEKSKQYVEW